MPMIQSIAGLVIILFLFLVLISVVAAYARLSRNSKMGNQRLEAILASMQNPVLIIDHKNHPVLANPAASQAFRLKDPSTISVIGDQELSDLLRNLEIDKPPVEVVLPDGKVYLASVFRVVPDGRPTECVYVMQDTAHIKELDALKSEFVSMVGHDLRSPLTLIRGYATLLDMSGDINDQQKSYVGKIVTAVESMTRMVNNLLDLGRIEAGVGLRVDKVDSLELLDDLVKSLQPQADQKNIRLEVVQGQDPPQSLDADRFLLQQAVYNLVENAIKYTSENGSVTLRVTTSPEGIQFIVQDNGIGIYPEDMPHLFEKFYRGSQREGRVQNGSGLGLAIVHSIAERHGGKVWVESELGEGSSFFLLIPFTQPGERK